MSRARNSIHHYVDQSVGRSIGYHFVQNHFFGRLELTGDQIWVTAPAQLLYWPCPPARDWCCRVYGLVLSLIFPDLIIFLTLFSVLSSQFWSSKLCWFAINQFSIYPAFQIDGLTMMYGCTTPTQTPRHSIPDKNELSSHSQLLVFKIQSDKAIFLIWNFYFWPSDISNLTRWTRDWAGIWPYFTSKPLTVSAKSWYVISQINEMI